MAREATAVAKRNTFVVGLNAQQNLAPSPGTFRTHEKQLAAATATLVKQLTNPAACKRVTGE